MAINTASAPTSAHSAEATEALPYPSFPELVPPDILSAGSYSLRFARTPEDLDTIQRLRFEVFNLELGEGLPESFSTGRDVDRFDAQCHHLVVEHKEGGVVGTYRIQTGEMAHAAGGFYTDGEYNLAALPPAVLADGVELGRACVAREHRKKPVLFLLWRGLATYMRHSGKRFLFGCCSLTSQDQAFGMRVHRHLDQLGAEHPVLRVQPRPDTRCESDDQAPPGSYPTPKIPALFQAYLTLGARTLGPPAIDREFKTIDWLVLLDVAELPGITYRAFFRHSEGEGERDG